MTDFFSDFGASWLVPEILTRYDPAQSPPPPGLAAAYAVTNFGSVLGGSIAQNDRTQGFRPGDAIEQPTSYISPYWNVVWLKTALLCGCSSRAFLNSCQFASINPYIMKNFALP
jgi:hypothetical protein